MDKEKMNKPLLIVMCGLQCSGKSTKGKFFCKKQNDLRKSNPAFKSMQYLSSDEYRRLYPDWNNNQIFDKLYKDMNTFLAMDNDVILDATNVSHKSRKNLLSRVKIDCVKIVHVMNIPYTTCKQRLEKRNQDPDSHKVPLEVLERYYRSFEIPFSEEGWDFITFENPLYVPHQKNPDKQLLDQLFELMVDYNQKCKWHLETLDDHCIRVHDYLAKPYVEGKCDISLLEAALLHDIGKIKTQKPKEKEPDEMCYYNHENVGAYDLMCFQNIFKRPLDSLFYINYHMKGFDANKSEKTYEKLKKRFGEDKLNQLLLFNEADTAGCRRAQASKKDLLKLQDKINENQDKGVQDG